ncbi:MAG: PIN domain-containing protein [Chloroflexi bacterium]|nr:PIN domain-containing protein [Chloroflexota bacterium]
MAILSYVESSALLRLCLREGDVTLVEEALASGAVSSQLTGVETAVALAARRHRRRMTDDDAAHFAASAEALLAALSLLEIDAEVRAEAVRIGVAHPVRTLDAIHVGTAAVVARQQRRHGNSVRFCTADLRQAGAARAVLGAAAVELLPPFS